MKKPDSVHQLVAQIVRETENWPRDGILTEAEYVDAAIQFANTGKANSVSKLLRGAGLSLEEGWEKQTDTQTEFDSVRTQFRSHLNTALSGDLTGESASPLRAYLGVHSKRLVLLPIGSFGREKTHIGYRYLPADLRAALSHALVLVLDSDRPYKATLCQCQLQECGKFFHVKRPKTGRPRKGYCSDEHMHKAHNLGASQRRKRLKMKRAEQAITKKLNKGQR